MTLVHSIFMTPFIFMPDWYYVACNMFSILSLSTHLLVDAMMQMSPQGNSPTAVVNSAVANIGMGISTLYSFCFLQILVDDMVSICNSSLFPNFLSQNSKRWVPWWHFYMRDVCVFYFHSSFANLSSYFSGLSSVPFHIIQ